uniref:Uncharacterized protein n=1 Tax=Anopheles epiroticus TaxID=199890 RepID=A0A182P670_9DIPT
MKRLDGALLSSAALVLVLLFSQVAYGLVLRPRRDIVEAGKAVVLQGVSKLKDALDHGVSAKSEGKHSIDLFGFKFGSGSSVNAGFGDAANEEASQNDDDLVRRRRALDVLGATYAYVSLLPQSPQGTNVNIVKVSSVSNVNNYGEMPAVEVATTAAAPLAERRKRSPDMVQLANFEKKSLSVESEVRPDKSIKTHEKLEAIHAGSRTLVKENLARHKRSPQSEDEDGNDEGSTKGPPPRGGPKGPHGRGPPKGCGRGPPPPEGEEEATMTTQTVVRRKREAKGPPQGVSCRGGGGGGGGGGGNGTRPSDGEVRRKRDTSSESIDYSSSDESEETYSSSRKRREALGGGEVAGKVGSWFEQLAGVFVDTVKKVVDVTKKTFRKGESAEP